MQMCNKKRDFLDFGEPEENLRRKAKRVGKGQFLGRLNGSFNVHKI
jgi:hypothetical protein